MKALVSQNHQSRVDEVPKPSLQGGDLLLKIKACGVCFSDVHKLRFQQLEKPIVLGHEVAGEVVEVGDRVEGWSSGDRVQVIAAIPCGACAECTRGRMTVCPNQTSIGYDYDGGFAEYMVVPAKVLAVDGLNRIPEGLSFAEASVAEPFACAINAQELARDKGIEERSTFRIADLLENPETIAPADVVVLNRVVCCSPDGVRLAREAARLAGSMLLLSYPRDRVLVRIGGRILNFVMWIMKRSFRVFMHSRESLYAAAQAEGLVVVETGQAFAWEFSAFRRTV
jgi:D-arabinose 1-dehydrogenase-like Zn-dependent alcohol dehydrogenase